LVISPVLAPDRPGSWRSDQRDLRQGDYTGTPVLWSQNAYGGSISQKWLSGDLSDGYTECPTNRDRIRLALYTQWPGECTSSGLGLKPSTSRFQKS